MSQRHIRRWYKKYYGADPLKLGLPYVSRPNPHHWSSEHKMKTWHEDDVRPYKSEKGMAEYERRSRAGRLPHERKRQKLIDWFETIQEENPRVGEITQRLWEIGKEIEVLHNTKEECRGGYDVDDDDYWELGIEHCADCEKWAQQQDVLREERHKLFRELEAVCGTDKGKIQLARSYRREKMGEEDGTETKGQAAC